jgi:hypothetical protein
VVPQSRRIVWPSWRWASRIAVTTVRVGPALRCKRAATEAYWPRASLVHLGLMGYQLPMRATSGRSPKPWPRRPGT